MSKLSRVISGSFASWIRVGLNMVIQVLLVPVYLQHWTASQYGFWLGLLALLGFAELISSSYQVYVGNIFLVMAVDNKEKLSAVMSSSFAAGIILGFGQFILVIAFIGAGFHAKILGIKESIVANETGTALFALMASSFVSGSVGGIAVRLASALGYFSRMAWWSVLVAVVTALSPVLFVVMGYGLAAAGISLSIAVVIVNIPIMYDLWRIIHRSDLRFVYPDIKWMVDSTIKSLAISAKYCLEMLRQQGARLVLVPLIGAAQMAQFVTMRTGANIATQGLGTITNPILPDLMGFLSQRDQERSDASFGMIWLVLAGVMAPAVVILQGVAPYLFNIWTAGKLNFDPLLFSLLSLTVLIYALGQPAIAVVHGNNLLRVQFWVSFFTGLVAVGGMYLLVPSWGVRGAGLALLVAEVLSLLVYRRAAISWMLANELRWPGRLFRYVAISVGVSGLAMLCIAFKAALMWWWVSVSLLILLFSFRQCFKSLPLMARQRADSIMDRVPGGRLIAAILIQ